MTSNPKVAVDCGSTT